MKKTIMVIDDEKSIRYLLSEIIEELGYDMVEAENAIVGLELLETIEPDLIILDIQMPQMNGIEATPKIKEIRKNVPIILLSAFGNLKDVVETMNLDIEEFISKPFDIDYLEKRIKEIVS